MLKRLAFIFPLFILIATDVQGVLVAGPQRVGVVEEMIGQAEASTKGQKRVLQNGDTIFLGDVIEVGSNGSVRIKFLDETLFTIGPKGSLTIDEFIYSPGSRTGEMSTKLTRGVFRLVTGMVDYGEQNSMEINFSVGTLGIRGTTVAGEVVGGRTSVVLLPSESKFRSPNHVGHVVLRNEVGGIMKETHIRNTGYGSMIEGEGIPPTETSLIPPDKVQRMLSKLTSPGSAPREVIPAEEDTEDQAVEVAVDFASE